MATYALRPIHPVKRLDGYTFVNKPLSAAQDFKNGAPALMASTGTLEEAGVNPAAIAGFFLAAAADYAWKADTFNTVEPSVPVATADQEFRGTLKGTFAAADVGTTFGITEDGTTGIWYVDRAKNASNQRVLVIGVEDGVVVGDVDVPCRFVVLTANRQVIS